MSEACVCICSDLSASCRYEIHVYELSLTDKNAYFYLRGTFIALIVFRFDPKRVICTYHRGVRHTFHTCNLIFIIISRHNRSNYYRFWHGSKIKICYQQPLSFDACKVSISILQNELFAYFFPWRTRTVAPLAPAAGSCPSAPTALEPAEDSPISGGE